MAKFFGTSSIGSLGDNIKMHDFPGWYLHYSISDMYTISAPGNYLNRKEFPIDFPVWFTKESVANGKDNVVDRALEWISSLVSVEENKLFPIVFSLSQNSRLALATHD